MKILHIVNGKLPQARGDAMSGVVRAAIEMAEAQAEVGHDVSVVSVGGATSWQGDRGGVRVGNLAMSRMPVLKYRGRIVDFRRQLSLIRYCRNNKFDVVHGHNHAYLRFLSVKRRLVHFHSDPLYAGRPGESLNFTRRDFDAVSKYTDAQICVSQFVASRVISGMGPSNAVYVVPNGTKLAGSLTEGDVNSLRSAFRAKHGIPDDVIVFSFVGAVTPEKGVEVLIKSFEMLFRSLPWTRLFIIGADSLWRGPDGGHTRSTYEENLREFVDTAGLPNYVYFLGRVDQAELTECYAGTDVVVVPSLWQEGFGLVAIEAMAFGRPVIASSVGGLPEIVSSDCGVMVKSDDVNELARAMKSLVDDPEKRRCMGSAGRLRSESFSWAGVADALNGIYKTLGVN